ncbi:septum formation inhibitor Maf [Synechococcus sp. RSCCF101]|uniref:Maf family protein n=1 Tax=Synechococcus sp. RSCCF101 TaxID=2511069 RepID=UPI001247A048|nr:nucleoside triphosphate pyrophosphatase [Synechococcus sp. RSCCF101]QEY31967.1 septum formation inhibitor Maf [Synechococcus sp. RSCCF101]
MSEQASSPFAAPPAGRDLVLASASPARRRLLEQAGLPHRVLVSGLDERGIQHADARELVQRLAQAKAEAVADRLPETGGLGAIGEPPQEQLVLGCDSLLLFDGEACGKPADAEEACRRWQRMRGHWGDLLTGHCLLRRSDGSAGGWQTERAVISTRVTFAALSDQEIRDYVATGEPLACAGCFALEGKGGMVVERLEGCYSNVIGLSLPWLRRALQA